MWAYVVIKHPAVRPASVVWKLFGCGRSSTFIYYRILTKFGMWLYIKKCSDEFENQRFSFIIGTVTALFDLEFGIVGLWTL